MSTRKRILKGINSLTKKVGIDFYYFLHKYQTYYNLEKTLGHAKSIKKQKSINKAGEFVPWFTYPAIHFLETRDISNYQVYEWGGGASSKYFSRKCKHIITVEDDKEWFKFLEKDKAVNQDLIFAGTKEEYVNSINKHEQLFDLIIVDGTYREDCLRAGVNKLNKHGFMVLDNSDWFPQDVKWLESQGLVHIPFQGFATINDYISVTSFFMKL